MHRLCIETGMSDEHMLSRVGGWTTLQPTHLIVPPNGIRSLLVATLRPNPCPIHRESDLYNRKGLLQSRLLEICFAIHSFLME
jgi:hypothetical protein